MVKDIIDIVREKEFKSLSVEEKVELSDICTNEDEFNNLKQVFLDVDGVAMASRVLPKKETKKELDELFVSTYPKATGVWYSSMLASIVPKNKPLHRQPLVQIAAVGLLVFLTIPFLNNTSIDSSEKQLVASDEHKTEEIADENNLDLLEEEVSSTSPVLDLDVNEFELVDSDVQDVENGLSHAVLANATGATRGEDDHPDGIFEGEEVGVSYSIPTSEQPELLDLLTTTF
ncbi:MAG: hypothetical protein MK066_03530 [Crocinitomicaceae bacterium]|nr:hypothetical protein [Crocinitomicaceae bacterium]